jgi:predicted amidohydrolase
MPSQNLKIAAIPLDIVAHDSEANLAAAIERLNNLDKDTDLAVLPEMFNTGFTPDIRQLESNAQPDDGALITELRSQARQRGIAIWGGFTAIDGGNYYNRGFMIDDKGEATFYDKRHLFSYGGESKVLTPGMKEAPIVAYRSWNLKMAICYDIRFPVWNRARANNYDVLIVPANWAHARFFAWKQMLLARAIENQAFVVGCNREGNDIYGEYRRGDSQAFNNWGDDIADRRDDGTMYATLHAEQFNIDRQRFAPWRDADDFKLYLE